MNHEAIYNLYPQVVTIDDGAGAFDANGNKVEIDEAAVQAEVERLIPIEQAKQTEANRKAAYMAESDPIFFMAQRGEATMEEWQAKVDEIKQRFPK